MSCITCGRSVPEVPWAWDWVIQGEICSHGCWGKYRNEHGQLQSRVTELEATILADSASIWTDMKERAAKAEALAAKYREALKPVAKLALHQDLTNHEVLAEIISGAKQTLKDGSQ